MSTNFVTAPDFVNENNFTVLLVDASADEVEMLAYLCGNHEESFNIYLYREDHSDLLYLNRCADRADAIIVNTEENGLSTTKDHFVDMPKTWYYGPKNFLGNPRRINNVIEFFINRANERKQSTSTL